MRKAVVYTLGCKVNDVESGSIIRGLENLGYDVSRTLEYADIYVINTCAVTAEAERKSRQTVGKAQKCNPNAKIIVCGCAAEKSPSAFLQKIPNVYVLGAKQKNRVLKLISSQFTQTFEDREDETRYEEMPSPKCLKTRNFVKIQDGCNRFCSYCIIPYLRGRNRGRLLQSAVAEIMQSTAHETVITGIDISAYQDENGKTLTDLLLEVKDADTRIRLGSMEVSLITPAFLGALKTVKNFAPQFHLSLQSGSSSVLKSMNRKYTREEYVNACRLIYEFFPFAAITTDIIVGFPTETEDDFLQTLSIIEEVGFSQIHAFPYSPREGTNAYKRYKEIPSAIKKERVARVLEVGEKQKEKYLQKQIGRTLCVVPELYIDGYTEGYAENYIRVYVPGDIGKTPTRVCVQGLFKDGVQAEIIKK